MNHYIPIHGILSVPDCTWNLTSFRDIFAIRLRGKIIILLFVLSSAFHASSAQNDWRIVDYSLDQGLSQISVNCIIRDSYGYLWVGTQDGLNKFDGYGFEVYRHQPSDPHSLSNSNIQSVIEDRHGNIWTGTQDGLNVFDRSSGTFQVYRHDPDNKNSVSDNNIHSILLDRTGILWIKTEYGIDSFDPETSTFRHFEHFNDVFNYVSGSNFYSIYEDSGGQLWIGSKDGLFLFDRGSEKFTRYSHSPDHSGTLSSNKVKSIFETSMGVFLVGTENGLNVLDRETGIFENFSISRSDENQTSMNVINVIFENSKGSIWVGTDAGLFTFSPGDGRFTALGELARTSPFFDQEVSAILEDRSNNMWIGTLGGLYMLDSKSKFNTYRIHDYMPDAPPAARFIASVREINDDELLIGTWGGGLFLLNRKSGEITHYSSYSEKRSQRISNDFVHVIFLDSRKRIIIGTRDGMDIFRPGSGFVPFCPTSDKDDCALFSSNRIYSIFEDSQEVIWVGTRYGLHSFAGGNITSYYHNPQDSTSISSNQVQDITECTEGYLWIATAEGLNRFDRQTGGFLSYTKDEEKGRFSLSNNNLTAILEDSGGNLWIGSVAGLNRFFRNTGSFMVFSEMEGLPNNFIYSLIEDDNGHIWLSTNNGIAKFDPANLELSSYDVSDGLQNYEFNLGARYKSETGELFFGGVDGFNSFFPDSLRVNEIIPPLVITSFEVISQNGTRRIITDGKDEILLEPDENSFNVEFASLDFTRPGKNRYAYKLEGLENNWINTGTRRNASFSRIPSGSYMLYVKGSNNDDVWNEEGVSLKITIVTPWWETIYAYIFFAVLVFLLVYMIILFSTRQLRIANQVLREKEQASTEIARQREELILKNRSITDSINYAKRIQLAMMPTSKHFRKLFPDSFVFYKPKDIVSGDFYWVNRRNDKVFFAVIDCTGHGVPGAFMSIIGYELLRNIINIKGFENPAEILNELNKDFSGIFNSEGDSDFSFRDGMDIGFCVIDRKLAVLEFAGAFSPMYIVRNNSIIEVKGNRFSVGLMEDIIDEPFKNHSLELRKNDMIYLFSDGYPDQFGGEDGKKFKYRRFRHLLLNIHTLPGQEQEKLLDQSIVQWMDGQEQVDDILIIGVRPGIGPA